MLNRRQGVELRGPEYEDAGIYKEPVGVVRINLTSKISINGRKDVVIQAFAQSDVEVEVVFAGRRAAIAEPVVTAIQRRWKQMQSASKDAKMEDLRFPIQVVGSSRPRFETVGGWLTRNYQLMVAQYSMFDENGKQLDFGEAPRAPGHPKQPAPLHFGD